ncbi:hypothetical protein [Chamaesiphon sp. OTE_75_metabat_556]|nr:hypothetical protein [Chamaesiphon sp. OTE_75_metabat_556]
MYPASPVYPRWIVLDRPGSVPPDIKTAGAIHQLPLLFGRSIRNRDRLF